jgi:hypothetical protein
MDLIKKMPETEKYAAKRRCRKPKKIVEKEMQQKEEEGGG